MKNKKIKIFAKILFSLFVIAVMTAAVGIAILVGEGYYIYDRVTAQRGIEDIVQQIQDAEDYVPYEEISPYMKDAIVAIEDHRFYSHAGIDPYATAKMAIINMMKGEVVGGGSSITQQLARNFYFTQEKKRSRKIAEAFVAFELEKRYTKEEILTLYLNIIYFGNNQYGIQAAAEYYYGITPSELTLPQAICLAGFPQAPSVYPDDPVKAEQRSRKVFGAMQKYMPQYTGEDAEEVFRSLPVPQSGGNPEKS